MVVQLGFSEPFESYPQQFTAEDVPSKVGGYPVWLNGSYPLKSNHATCNNCHQPMSMLLQLFTPQDDLEHAFHRVCYVFICKNGQCHRAESQEARQGAIKVYRSQLPELYDESRIQCGTVEQIGGCVVCGLKGTKKCGSCRQVNYCCRDHQVLDWKKGHHKRLCSKLCGVNKTSSSHTMSAGSMNMDIDTIMIEGAAAVSYISSSSSLSKTSSTLDDLSSTRIQYTTTFAQSEIVCEDEPNPNEMAISEIQSLTSKIELSSDMRDAIDKMEFEEKDEECEDSQVPVDRCFLKFQKRITAEPQQVVRYVRESMEDDFEPLWANDTDKPTEEMIGFCSSCGRKRTFEFQIMPQILNHLNINHLQKDAIDFGTLIVYSCPNSCPSETNPYDNVQEYIHHQNFSQDGMQNKWKEAQRKQIENQLKEE